MMTRAACAKPARRILQIALDLGKDFIYNLVSVSSCVRVGERQGRLGCPAACAGVTMRFSDLVESNKIIAAVRSELAAPSAICCG